MYIRGSARQVKKLYSIRINIALDSGFPYNRREEPGEGKWTCKEGDRYVIPVTILCNHALVDGVHMAKFFEGIERHFQDIK